MRFNHLKASIANNIDQEPTLFMALCMVESLFRDMEDEADIDISLCPVGDERLSTKLVWLCRCIGDIYDDNCDELQRNRTRLDSALSKIRGLEKELEDLAIISDQLLQMQNKYVGLENELKEARKNKQKFDILKEQTAQAEKDIAQLLKFEPQTAEKNLSQLRDQICSLQTRRMELESQQQRDENHVANLLDSINALERQRGVYTIQVEELNEQLRGLEAATIEAEKNLSNLEEQRLSAKEELKDIRCQCDEKSDVIKRLRHDIQSFRTQVLEPVVGEMNYLETKKKDLEEDAKAAEKISQSIREEIDKLVLKIGRLKKKADEDSTELKDTAARLEKSKMEKTLREKEMKALIQNLSILQDEVDRLTSTVLPEHRRLVAEEEARKENLDEQISDLCDRLKKLADERQEIQEKLPTLEEKLKNNQDIYSSLTAEYAASTEELESLERQITELQNKNDQEKIAIYGQQLRDHLKHLQVLETECSEIRSENERMRTRLEECQMEKSRLLDLQEKHRRGNDAIAKLLLELKPISTPEYTQEVTMVGNRLEILEVVRSKMASSVRMMNQTLAIKPFPEELSLDEQLRAGIHQLQICTDDLRCMLVKCANSLKLEEQ